VLAARLDRLPPAVKRLVQIAAVIGHEVPGPLLEQLAGLAEDGLQGGLAHLQEAELLYETHLVPEPVYTFKHALTHEVAYGSLLQERRRALHARIAEVIEMRAGDRVPEQIAQLAHHALRGEMWDKAFRYCQQAGSRAFGKSAYRETVEYWEQALEALAHLPADRATQEQAIDLYCDLTMALIPFGQWEQRLSHLRVAEAIAEALADQRRLGRIYHRLAVTLQQMRQFEPALAYGQRTHAIAAALGDVDLQAWATYDLGQISLHLGDYRQAIVYLQQTLTALRGQPYDPSYRAPAQLSIQAHVHLVQCCSQVGAFAAGVGHGDAARQIAAAGARPYERAAVDSRVGALYLAPGTLHLAIPLLERAVAVSQDATIPVLYPGAAAALACAYALAGRGPDAGAILEQVGALESCRFPTPLRGGEAYLRTRRVEEAHRLAQRALLDAREHTMRGWEAWARWLLGEVAVRRDPPDVASAEAHYQQALALAEALGMRPLQAHCHLGLGTLFATTSRPELARAALSTAIELYRAMGMTFWLPQAETVLAAVDES
jgi:tetratricopeptide (TPR) repeat protein